MSSGPGQSRPPPLQPSISAPAPASSPTAPATSPTTLASPTEPNSILSRTYVIPPRPKPGRKPATDTPQTKRKEQNREAQRAFRERRAARVGELEEEMASKTKAWADREAVLEQALRDQQHQLQFQIDSLRARNHELEQALDWERRARVRVEEECQARRKESSRYSASSITSYASGGSTPWSNRAVSPVTQEKLNFRATRSLPTSRSDAGRQPRNSDAFDPDCRRCENGGTCACLEQRLATVVNVQETPTEDAEPMEIDFTTQRDTQTLMPTSSNDYAPHDTGALADPCGFCTDSQNCVCKTYSDPPRPPNLPSTSSGPGSCDKCQSDPERARFCRSLAAATPLGPPLPPPSTAAPTITRPAAGRQRRLPSIDEKMAMSCDQAYDTLSKEPSFRDRRNSLSFINQLRARPVSERRHTAGDNPIQLANNSALEVDIAGVLAAMRAERNEEMERRR